ncbi:MAG: hypothetical protein EBZ61_08105 [Micrococcales bacterium]|nr:hypothetical protein [Micrococcales bacterium]
MAIPGIQEIQALATKYSKPQLQKMAQMGLVDPTKAVMAGMMIDRIQKQNMQPPQQTVAEEVMGGPPPMPQGAPPPAPPEAAGIAGLPSGLPPQMAGGGIVAFAEGGDTDGYADGGVVGYKEGDLVKDAGITGVIDPNWASSKSFKRNYSSDDKFAVLAEQLAQLTAAERQAQGVDKIRIQKDMEELRAAMRGLKASPRAQSLVDQIPLGSAGAAEAKPAASKTAASSQVGGDAVYSPEGVLLYGEPDTVPAQRKIEPGQPYEGNLLRDILEGRPNAPLPKIERRVPAPAPAAEAPPAPPKVAEKPAEKPAAKEEMGPARPSAAARLESQIADLRDKAGKEITVEDAVGEQERAFEKLGVNKDFFNNLRSDLEGTRGKFKDRADKAAGHALMMFGAGLMGARRGSEFETASRSAQQSLMMYMGTMDKISDQEEKLNQSLRELSVSEEQLKRTRATSALDNVEKNRQKVADRQVQIAELENRALVALTNAAVEEFKNNNPAEYQKYKRISESTGKPIEEVIKMFTGGRSGEITRTTAFKEYNDLIANPMFKAEIDKRYPGGFEDYFRALQGGAPAAGGKVKFLGYEGQ